MNIDKMLSTVCDSPLPQTETDFRTETDSRNERAGSGVVLPWRVPGDNGPDIAFDGSFLAELHSGYGWGSYDPIHHMFIFRTVGGKYVAWEVRAAYRNRDYRHRTKVLDTEADVREFFGCSGLAREIYEKAGFADTVMTVA